MNIEPIQATLGATVTGVNLNALNDRGKPLKRHGMSMRACFSRAAY